MAMRLCFVLFAFFLLTGCAAMLEPPSDIQRAVDYLRQDVQKLTKQQEELAKKIDNLSQTSQKQIEAKESTPVETISVEDAGNLSSDPSSLYEKAMKLMKEGKYEDAETAFAQFVRDFPQSDLADNAQYWMGECLYSEKKYKEAKETFEGVLEHFPFGNKVPDAMYKAALCAGQLGDNKERVEILKEVKENYPFSDAAEKAEKLLKEIESQNN
ncbi:MAG: tol-pal system protein YbgF [Thermoanaerobaculaceae bacterium]|nr:tol-pal system protein YbgF [Thermoanaerobaculaceae bacterium]